MGNNLIYRIRELEKQEYDGVLKIGIEYGKVNSVSLSNKTEIPVSVVSQRYMPENFMARVNRHFLATLFLCSQEGK